MPIARTVLSTRPTILAITKPIKPYKGVKIAIAEIWKIGEIILNKYNFLTFLCADSAFIMGVAGAFKSDKEKICDRKTTSI